MLRDLKNIIILLLLSKWCFSQHEEQNRTYVHFTENKGQWNENALFKADIKGGAVFLEKSAFSFLCYPNEGIDHRHEPDKTILKSASFHVFKIEFENASANTVVLGKVKKEFYSNYFLGNDKSKWASKVSSFQEIEYNNLKQGISMNVFSEDNNLRFDLYANAHADISELKLKFSGQNYLILEQNKILIQTSVGRIEMQSPKAFQTINGVKKRIACFYELKGDKVSFQLASDYDPSFPILIDPTIVFATYSGSTADNWGMTATYDYQGNAFTGGITFNAGYPTTSGAFQVSFNGGQVNTTFPWGGFDITLTKFNPTGTSQIYSTYLGGTNNELPLSLITDNAGNLVMLGRTYSTDFPVLTSSYDNSFNGVADLVVTKFNSTGSALIGSTYFGGSDKDGVNMDDYEPTLISLKHNYSDDGRGEIFLDKQNNVYVGACTNSTDFPITLGAAQVTNAGAQDGCFFKMTDDLSGLIYSSYLGGSSNDAVYSIGLNSKNQLYLTGGTESVNFPVTAGAYQSVYGNLIDGFVTLISSNGSSILHSSFIGTGEYDQSYFVQVDKYDEVYLYGQTAGIYPVSSNVYSNPNSGQFIHKLDSTLSVTRFSTIFGNGTSAPNLDPTAFLVDQCGNIYISGWGGGLATYFSQPYMLTTGMPTTPDAFQLSTDGADFYFMVLSKNAAALKYGTFFGGTNISEHVDGGTSRFDKTGKIYQGICGGCGSQDGMPTTPGAWSNTNNSNNCNNALVKFNFDMDITVADLVLNPAVASGCAPFTVGFINLSVNGVQYEWIFGDGTSSTQVSPSHTFVNPGTYEVMLIAIDSSTCNIRDTTYSEIIVGPPMQIDPIPPVNVCRGDSFQLNVNVPGGIAFEWTPATGLNNSQITNPMGLITAPQTYTVQVSNGVCSNSQTVAVNVNTNSPQIVANTSQQCSGNPVMLTTDTIYSSYLWNGSFSTNSLSVSLPGTIYLETTDFNGCVGRDTFQVDSVRYVDFEGYDTIMCENTTMQLFAPLGPYQYSWTPLSTLSADSIYNPVASPEDTTIYLVTITNGPCVSTDTITVNVIKSPTINVSPDEMTILPGESVDFSSDASEPVFWSPPRDLSCIICSSTSATPDTISTYYGTIYMANGCSATDSVKIWLSPVLYIPNAFSPNSDVHNQVFRPECIGYVSIEVFIFNRWGEEIYKWNTFEGGWDGKYKGVLVQEDVYIYKLRAVDYLDNEIEKAGTVTVVR